MNVWHLIHSKIRQESVALTQLERQGFECFLPQIRAEKLRRGVLVTDLEPLFPRYLFVRLGTGLAAQSWAPIRSTIGVSRLVTFGNVPARLDDELVASIRAQSADCVPVRHQFEPGELVRVTKGPFAGIEAIYQMSDGESRVMVLLTILSKSVQLTIAPTDIRKAS
jgi:transcriptional antiterminator RfaH